MKLAALLNEEGWEGLDVDDVIRRASDDPETTSPIGRLLEVESYRRAAATSVQRAKMDLINRLVATESPPDGLTTSEYVQWERERYSRAADVVAQRSAS